MSFIRNLADGRRLNLVRVVTPYGTGAVLFTQWGGLEVHMSHNGYWRTLDGSLMFTHGRL